MNEIVKRLPVEYQMDIKLAVVLLKKVPEFNAAIRLLIKESTD